VFDTPSHGRPKKGRDQWERARAICADCPVQLQCLEDALNEDVHINEHGGTFQAGLTPQELATLRARRRAS
jgi:hypothetical protein